MGKRALENDHESKRVVFDLGPDADADAAETAVLDCLGDAVSRDVLVATFPEAKSASALADACGVSRSTVYRRLQRLVDLGLVREMPRTDGTAKAGTSVFRTVPGQLQVGITPQGYTVRGYAPDDPTPENAGTRRSVSCTDVEVVEDRAGSYVDVTVRIPVAQMERLVQTTDGLADAVRR